MKLDDFRGRPLLVVFFADFSPPSTEALTRLQRVLGELPKDSVAAMGVSLDAKREALDEVIKSTSLTWPIAFDGKSWDGELVRSLGINALPTVWLCDKQGTSARSTLSTPPPISCASSRGSEAEPALS